MALMSVGVILEWGDNEYGQMGNKKRSVVDNPVIMSRFLKNNVLNIHASSNKSAVIIEDI